MLFLLPPSETKRGGGLGAPLHLDALSFASLNDARRGVLGAVQALSGDDGAAARALKLGARSAAAELKRNKALTVSPTMPAIERYTGVLFDALAIQSAAGGARDRASRHVVVHSALWGLLRADDPIPAYRLSHDSRLPELRLRTHWAVANTAVLDGRDEGDVVEGPIIDLRSESYAALGPLPARADAMFVRVVAIADDGAARALNHFNKKGKGEFLRDVLAAGPMPTTIDELCRVSTALGWPLRRRESTGARQHGELELVVSGAVPHA
jgi:cytoplasmic iron level regulating protein YaaA (DUF328/UPF0246 family)